MAYSDILKARRSMYILNDQLPVSQDLVTGRIKEAMSLSPTAFMMQDIHAVILTGNNHKKLWDKIVHDTLQKIVPPEPFKRTEVKLSTFSQAAGTILLVRDLDAVEQMKKDYATYAAEMDAWSWQDLGIAMVNIWNSLAEINVGANIQHYNPLIDDEVKATWDIPDNYQLVGQMVYGGIISRPGDKERKSGDELVKVVAEQPDLGMTQEEFDDLMRRGDEEIASGKYETIDEVFDRLNNKYGINAWWISIAYTYLAMPVLD